jgi:uncharacterized LabA/DUF88 family protein
MKTAAVLIDGGYFDRRINYFKRKYFTATPFTAKQLQDITNAIVFSHLRKFKSNLYRVYFYDCPPLDKNLRYPIPENPGEQTRTWTAKKHPPYILKNEFHDLLRKSRKTALRLGVLSASGDWTLTSHALKALLSGQRQWTDIANVDFYYNVTQKMVDTKLGVDITSLALKKQIDTIILVAGDSDFVPAAKMARKEGIDFILDPMWGNASNSLTEHIDGLYSPDIVRIISSVLKEAPLQLPTWWENQPPAANEPVVTDEAVVVDD